MSSEESDFGWGLRKGLGALVCTITLVLGAFFFVTNDHAKNALPLVEDGKPLDSAASDTSVPSHDVPNADGSATPLSFNTLADYKYDAPEHPTEQKRLDAIPQFARAFDGKRVSVRGFVIPTD